MHVYCLTQREDGRISNNTSDVINMTQGQMCDDLSALVCLVEPLLIELLKGQYIDQVTAIEFLKNTSGMQQSAMLEFTQLNSLITLSLNMKRN